MQLNTDLSVEQEYFLKRLAAQQFKGSIFNYLGDSPIHVIQYAEPKFKKIQSLDDAEFIGREGELPLPVDKYIRNQICIPFDAGEEAINAANTTRLLSGDAIYVPYDSQEDTVEEYLEMYEVSSDNLFGYTTELGVWEPVAYAFTRASAMSIMSELKQKRPGMYRAFADPCPSASGTSDFALLYKLLVMQGKMLLEQDWASFDYKLIQDDRCDIETLEQRVASGEELPINVGTLIVDVPEYAANDHLAAGNYELEISLVKAEESDYSYPFVADVTFAYPIESNNEFDTNCHGLATIQYPFTGDNKFDKLNTIDGWKQIFDFARFMA